MLDLFFPEFKVSSLYRPEAPSKSLQGFTLCFQLLFLFYHPFITGVLHWGSTWWFVKDSFHSSIVLQDFSRSFDLPSYTQKLTWCSTHVLFWGDQVFFFLHFQVQFFLPYLLRWCYAILDNSLRVSWFTSFQEWHILNPSFSIRSWDPLQPINLFIGIILGYISPKAFPRDCCYLWCS